MVSMACNIGETDLNLAALIRGGDSRAFDTLFTRYYAPLCRYSMRFVNSRDVSEDIAQEVLIRIWIHRDRWFPESSVRCFLERAVKNASIDYLRRLRLKESREECDSEPLTGSLVDEVEKREVYQHVMEAVSLLPEGSRTIFFLSRDEGLTYQEIAERLCVSVKTVETQMGRALRALRKCVGELSEVIR